MKSRIPCLTLFLLLVSLSLLGAQNSESQAAGPSGDHLTVKVALIGPGDELYFWWGHIGLVIDNGFSGESRFYDYGVFSFDNENFFLNFAFGRLLYSCAVTPAEWNVRNYVRTNRDIFLLTLDLPGEKKQEIYRFAERNVLPENRDYYYHHFNDNCATRIRDIIDLGVDGQFSERFAEAPGRFTLRQHVRRHTWFSPFFDWFLNFCMGRGIDEPITVWQEMFLPSEIGRNIETFSYIDSDGRERPLVSSVETVNRALKRPPVLDLPRKQWPRELALGLGLAALMLFLGLLRKKTDRAGRVLYGSAQSLFGFFFGIAGSLLFFLSFFTNHDYTYHNSNILFINPLLLAALPLGIIYAAGKGRSWRISPERLLKYLWTISLAGGIISMLIKLLPRFCQQNQVSQALFLPVCLVLSCVPRWTALIAERKKDSGRGRNVS